MAEQTYKDRWQTAAFRNVAFLTDSHDARGGRRLAVHEFPGAEQPLVEDLGGLAGAWTINAYFLGAQYDQDADVLITELNRIGADWLIHPWLGRMWVRPISWARHESNAENGFCTITIDFVPGGEQPAAATQDKVDTAQGAIDGFAGAAMDDFDLLDMATDGIAAFTDVVSTGMEMVRSAISFAALPLSWSQQILTGIYGFKSDIATLANMPKQYASRFNSLVNSIGFGSIDNELPSKDRPRLVKRLASLSVRPVYVVPAAAVNDVAVRKSLVAEQALQSRLFLSAAMQVTLADFTTDSDRAESLAAIDVAYDAMLPTLPDVVFQAAVTARTALIEAVMAQDLKPLVIKDIVEPLPSTVLAHKLQLAEDIFIARNGVRHPLFVRGRVYG